MLLAAIITVDSELGHFSLFRILLKYILRQAHQVLQETQKKLLESG
jgi:hypothetical protein